MNFIKRFMAGRYGSDQLGLAMIIACIILNIVARISGLGILSAISFVLLVLCIVRMLSRNYARRQAENLKFLKLYGPAKNKVKSFINRLKDSREHKYIKCPSCKNTLRLPKKKGKIRVTCPKCGNKFETKT